ncbi:MAG: type VII secretion-associated serine protease mycosin, partial [Pseudonocardia sp.]|nr:type VII secretion-associated serine protease mycosin [Pseudonocardia sp.]
GARPTPQTSQLGPTRCGPTGAATAAFALDVGERMHLARLHRFATGKGQRIAVIDTGVSRHPSLAGRLVGGGDYLSGGSGLDDCDGHGTAVAGIIAARPPPGAPGMTGMAPDAEVLSVRQSSNTLTITDRHGAQVSPGNTTTLAMSIVLAVEQGATVINVSEAACVGAADAPGVGDLMHAALDYAAERDVVVVAAAGNVATDVCAGRDVVSLPGWFDEDVVAVGATDQFDKPATFSFRAPYVDVAAPGSGLHSLAPGGGYTTKALNGTSFSAPWVAGLAALIRERFPQLTARQVVERIKATARRPPTGRNAAVGHGVIDPVAALTTPPRALAANDEQVPRPAATLPGTTPLPVQPAQRVPYDLVAVGVLVLVSAVAAVRLRRPR